MSTGIHSNREGQDCRIDVVGEEEGRTGERRGKIHLWNLAPQREDSVGVGGKYSQQHGHI